MSSNLPIVTNFNCRLSSALVKSQINSSFCLLSLQLCPLPLYGVTVRLYWPILHSIVGLHRLPPQSSSSTFSSYLSKGSMYDGIRLCAAGLFNSYRTVCQSPHNFSSSDQVDVNCQAIFTIYHSYLSSLYRHAPCLIYIYREGMNRRGSVVVSTSACRSVFDPPDKQQCMLLGVNTWVSTQESVYLCIFRRRHTKPSVPSIWCLSIYMIPNTLFDDTLTLPNLTTTQRLLFRTQWPCNISQ